MKNHKHNCNTIKLNAIVYFLISMLLSIPAISFSQNSNSRIEKMKSAHHEVPNDSYTVVSRELMEKSPAYRFSSSNFFTIQVNIDEDGNNIVGDAANEPSIAIDPTNSNRMVIGWRQFDDIGNDFRQAGYAYTEDGGQSWVFPGVIDPGVFRSDPVLEYDSDGNFYYNSLTVDEAMNFECTTYRILDDGVEWDDGVFSYGGDKLWMTIDRTDGIGAGNNYSFWSFYASACNGASTRSIDGGDNYENCVAIPGGPVFGTMAIDVEGTVYSFGAYASESGFLLAKSTTAQNPDNPVTWDNYVSVNLDGDLGASTPINPEGLSGQAWVDIDVSDGSGRGNIYLLSSVVRNSNNDPADVMFVKSTDGGQTYSAPIRINTDEETDNYQWFGTMSVAPNGRIDVVWLDTRDAPQNSQYLSELYYSYSIDQGETWSENEKLSESFDPHIGWPIQKKMGDYYDMVSDNEGVHLAWANTLNDGEDVYYARIKPVITEITEVIDEQYYQTTVFPNPFRNETTFSFFLKDEEHINIEIYNILGNKVKTLLNRQLEAGSHQFKWDGKNRGGQCLPKGVYFYSFKVKNYCKTGKVMITN